MYKQPWGSLWTLNKLKMAYNSLLLIFFFMFHYLFSPLSIQKQPVSLSTLNNPLLFSSIPIQILCSQTTPHKRSATASTSESSPVPLCRTFTRSQRSLPTHTCRTASTTATASTATATCWTRRSNPQPTSSATSESTPNRALTAKPPTNSSSPPPEMGNLLICNQKPIETITLPITIGNWHYSRIRVIGNVVESLILNSEKTITVTFYNDIQKIQIYLKHKIQFYQ